MKAAIEKHSEVVLALMREIHNQPEALIGPLLLHLTEELSGVETRVRNKIQELQRKGAEKENEWAVEEDAANDGQVAKEPDPAGLEDAHANERGGDGECASDKKRQLQEGAAGGGEEHKYQKVIITEQEQSGHLEIPLVYELETPPLGEDGEDDKERAALELCEQQPKKRDRDDGDDESVDGLKHQKAPSELDVEESFPDIGKELLEKSNVDSEAFEDMGAKVIGANNLPVETRKSKDEGKDAPPAPLWKVGTKLEAEMMDPEYSDYQDTLHPVEVVKVLDGGKDYRCRLLAFNDQSYVDTWRAEVLHEPREHDDNVQWKKGDEVHFRIRNRKVRKSRQVTSSFCCLFVFAYKCVQS
jgi:hypothetical protein